MDRNKLDIVKNLTDNADKITIVTHIHPDGDAVGSSFGLLSYLTGVLKKECKVIVATAPARQMEFIIDRDRLIVFKDNPEEAKEWIEDSQIIYCLDFNVLDRAGEVKTLVMSSNSPKVLIDHHPSPCLEEFDYVFSTTEVSSASELTYDFIMSMKEISSEAGRIPEAGRTALLTGMTTDTNNFGNSVFPGTLRMCSELLEAGTDREIILQHIYNEYSEGRIRVIGKLLGENLRITPSGLAYMILDKETADSFKLEDGDMEGVVNMPLSIKEVKMSIFLREDNGFYRVSIRSKRGYSSNRLAREKFNGGGHEQAAGGKLFWPENIARKEEAGKYIVDNSEEFL